MAEELSNKGAEFAVEFLVEFVFRHCPAGAFHGFRADLSAVRGFSELNHSARITQTIRREEAIGLRKIKGGGGVNSYLSALSGNGVFLGLDNSRMTRSLKERRALNRILSLTEEERVRRSGDGELRFGIGSSEPVADASGPGVGGGWLWRDGRIGFWWRK